MNRETLYSQILEELKKNKDIKELLNSEKIVVIYQLWEKDNPIPERLEIIHSTHPDPRYAVRKKYEFKTGIYNVFLFGLPHQGYEVLLVNEEDGEFDWAVWHLKRYPVSDTSSSSMS